MNRRIAEKYTIEQHRELGLLLRTMNVNLGHFSVMVIKKAYKAPQYFRSIERKLDVVRDKLDDLYFEHPEHPPYPEHPSPYYGGTIQPADLYFDNNMPLAAEFFTSHIKGPARRVLDLMQCKGPARLMDMMLDIQHKAGLVAEHYDYYNLKAQASP